MTRLALPLLAAALLVGAGCYKDDTTSPLHGKPLARVLLTDAPFPYDSVASVNVYVASIDASSDIDTTGGGTWVRVATPDVPIPFSPPLEQAVLPNVDRVREACRELLAY